MTGVNVKGMIIWKINKAEGGALKAYTNLGADLCSANPKSANKNLMQQAASIIRNKIANVSLNDCLRNRIAIRDEVKIEMQKICDGWGVYLESVEITEVLISSSSVFSDLQADYREKMHQKAEMIKMDIDSELK